MTAIDVSTPVVVLHFHHGSLGVARSLGRLGVDVYGVDSDPRAPALASRYCRGSATWDFRRSDPADSLQFLLEFAERIGRHCILIPASDDSALFVAENAATLSERYMFQRNSPEVVRSLSDKRDLYFLARELGVPTPETAFPETYDEAAEFAQVAVFPIMLKGIDGLRLQARTGRKMVIVHSPEELLQWYRVLQDPAHPNLMLQEYIPGGDDTIWMFNGYFDEKSECRAAFTGKKLRQHPVHVGATSLGICLENPMIVEETIRFMKVIGYRGILDIGYRYDARNGEYKLLDPNPRIGSTFRLFVAENGMDVARCLYLDLTGQAIADSVQREGRKWLVEDRDLESSLDYAMEGTLTLRQWLRSMRGVEEAAWFAWDDLLPFGRICGAMAGRGVRWVQRQTRYPRVASPGPSTEYPPAPEYAGSSLV